MTSPVRDLLFRPAAAPPPPAPAPASAAPRGGATSSELQQIFERLARPVSAR